MLAGAVLSTEHFMLRSYAARRGGRSAEDGGARGRSARVALRRVLEARGSYPLAVRLLALADVTGVAGPVADGHRAAAAVHPSGRGARPCPRARLRTGRELSARFDGPAGEDGKRHVDRTGWSGIAQRRGGRDEPGIFREPGGRQAGSKKKRRREKEGAEKREETKKGKSSQQTRGHRGPAAAGEGAFSLKSRKMYLKYIIPNIISSLRIFEKSKNVAGRGQGRRGETARASATRPLGPRGTLATRGARPGKPGKPG